MATNRPVTASSRRSPVAVSSRVTDSRARPPPRPTTLEFQAKAIFGFALARSAMTALARSWSRRWTTVTERAKRVRYRASSMAESPPPTTAMSWSLKKKPSQVAQ